MFKDSSSPQKLHKLETSSTSSSTTANETDGNNSPKNIPEISKEKAKNTTQPKSIKKRKQIHQTFLQLKKRLNVNTSMRKTQIDSLLKKCKSKAFKSIHEAIKKCLLVKIERLPQRFITNIKIDLNKHYLEQDILSIYRENNIFSSLEELVQAGYVKPNKENILKVFLSLKLKEVFDYYINSKQYILDYIKICKREGEKFAALFDFISRVFIQYYLKSKGNKPKKMKKDRGLKCINTRKNYEQIFLIRKLKAKH